MIKIKFLKNSGLSKNFMGGYDELTDTIFINKNLSLKEKSETILHELGHYIIHKFNLDDTYHWLLDILTAYYATKSKRKRIKYIKIYTKYYF